MHWENNTKNSLMIRQFAKHLLTNAINSKKNSICNNNPTKTVEIYNFVRKQRFIALFIVHTKVFS